MNKLLLLCALLLSALLPVSARAAECTEITTPNHFIENPGRYCLGADIVSSTQTIVFINSSRVELDCRGYTMQSTNGNTTLNQYGVYVFNRYDVHVRNCHIAGGFAAGIYAYQDNGIANINQNMSFTGNTVTGTHWYGIFAYGTNIDVSRNQITRIGGRASFAMGIRVGGSTQAGQTRAFTVRDNVVRDVVSPVNNAYGIYANNANASAFTGNIIGGTDSVDDVYSDFGIKLAQGSDNRITGNQVHGSGNINAIGIAATAGDACFDNYLRGVNDATLGCNATLGNY
jgi:nitrous oxidase accessory protein NosD